MAGSLGRPTQLLLIASIKVMTTQRALIRELWALGRKLRVETVTLMLLLPAPPTPAHSLIKSPRWRTPAHPPLYYSCPATQQSKMPFTPF